MAALDTVMDAEFYARGEILLARARAEREFWETNWKDLLSRYLDRFVAVLVTDGSIVADSATLVGIFDILGYGRDTPFPDNHYYVRFITDRPWDCIHHG